MWSWWLISGNHMMILSCCQINKPKIMMLMGWLTHLSKGSLQHNSNHLCHKHLCSLYQFLNHRFWRQLISVEQYNLHQSRTWHQKRIKEHHVRCIFQSKLSHCRTQVMDWKENTSCSWEELFSWQRLLWHWFVMTAIMVVCKLCSSDYHCRWRPCNPEENTG